MTHKSDPIPLRCSAERILTPRAPFHFDGTVYKPSYFPGPDLVYEPGHLWHSFRFAGETLAIRMDNLGGVEDPGAAPGALLGGAFGARAGRAGGG